MKFRKGAGWNQAWPVSKVVPTQMSQRRRALRIRRARRRMDFGNIAVACRMQRQMLRENQTPPGAT